MGGPVGRLQLLTDAVGGVVEPGTMTREGAGFGGVLESLAVGDLCVEIGLEPGTVGREIGGHAAGLEAVTAADLCVEVVGGVV